MKYHNLFFVTLLFASIIVAGCDSSGALNESASSERDGAFQSEQQDTRVQQAVQTAIDALTVKEAAKTLGRPPLWADGELFVSVVTPTSFKPTSGPFDELYAIGVMGYGFKDGVPLISESKPGDQDFNGGRWHLNVLKAEVDPDKYANAYSVDDLDLNDFMSTNDYFECPVLPRRGRGN